MFFFHHSHPHRILKNLVVLEDKTFTVHRPMKLLQKYQFIPQPIEHVFSFYADVRNLPQLLPKFMGFEILKQPNRPLQKGDHLKYKVSLFGIPFYWESEIPIFDPPYRFVDTQTSGPYYRFAHSHNFIEVEHGTLVLDTVAYQSLPTPLHLIGDLWVAPTLEAIFASRQQKIADHFQAPNLLNTTELSYIPNLNEERPQEFD